MTLTLNPVMIAVIIVALLVIVGVSFIFGTIYRKKVSEAKIGAAEAEAMRIVNEAVKEAQARKKESLIEAKDEIFKLKSEADKEIKERRSDISRQEKRLIHVTVSQVNDFVMIRIENYYEGDLKIDGDDYLTTKGDAVFHGYGIKSIKYTVQRYDGAVYINTDNNWFDLKIAIPKR